MPKCISCGEKVARTTPVCPHCGEKWPGARKANPGARSHGTNPFGSDAPPVAPPKHGSTNVTASQVVAAFAAVVVVIWTFGTRIWQASPGANSTMIGGGVPSGSPAARALNYAQLDADAGCQSKNSENKKDDLFKANYKNRWFVVRNAKVLRVEDRNLSLNMDRGPGADLRVTVRDGKEIYELQKDQLVDVTFKMTSTGGCILPFGGQTY